MFIIITIITTIVAIVWHIVLYTEHGKSPTGGYYDTVPRWKKVLAFWGSLVPYYTWYLLYLRYHEGSPPVDGFKPWAIIKTWLTEEI